MLAGRPDAPPEAEAAVMSGTVTVAANANPAGAGLDASFGTADGRITVVFNNDGSALFEPNSCNVTRFVVSLFDVTPTDLDFTSASLNGALSSVTGGGALSLVRVTAVLFEIELDRAIDANQVATLVVDGVRTAEVGPQTEGLLLELQARFNFTGTCNGSLFDSLVIVPATAFDIGPALSAPVPPKVSIVKMTSDISATTDFMFDVTVGGPVQNGSPFAQRHGDPAESMGAITDDQGVITEQVAAGFTLTDITCLDGGSLPVNVPAVDLGARSVTLTPVADEDITCNFMNTKVGSISIAKNAVPDADHTFNFTGLNGAFTINDNNADESVHVAAAPFNGLGPGTYSFTETDANAAPYTLTGIACNSSGGFPVHVQVPRRCVRH